MPATCRTNWPTAGCHRINEAARNIYFAWSGGISPSAPRYYRIQTPSFLIEFDDTQDNANHIHSVWRDFTGDFGEDLLQQHYEAGHHRNTALVWPLVARPPQHDQRPHD